MVEDVSFDEDPLSDLATMQEAHHDESSEPVVVSPPYH
jgi:hypothetical protein